MLRVKRSSRNRAPWQIPPKQVCAERHRAWQSTRSLGSSGEAHLADLSRGDAPCLGTRCTATPYRALPVKSSFLGRLNRTMSTPEQQQTTFSKANPERPERVSHTTAERVGLVPTYRFPSTGDEFSH